MAETQRQSTYTYTPSSAQSTRQILDSISQSAVTKPKDVVFRPPIFTSKSSNYAEADARARAFSVAENSTGDSRKENHDEMSPASGASASWKPKVGRRQSWNQQDLKRAMQMSSVGENMAPGPGFTEAQK